MNINPYQSPREDSTATPAETSADWQGIACGFLILAGLFLAGAWSLILCVSLGLAIAGLCGGAIVANRRTRRTRPIDVPPPLPPATP
jgi:hypothetical protein